MNKVDPLEAIIAQSNDNSINKEAAAIASSLDESDTSESSEPSEPKTKKHKKNFKKGPTRTLSIPLPKGSAPIDASNDTYDPISTFDEEKVEYANSERKVRKKESMEESSWLIRHRAALKYTGYTVGGVLLLVICIFLGYKLMLWHRRRKYSNILTEDPHSMSGGAAPIKHNKSNVVTVKIDDKEHSWSEFSEEDQPDYDINVNRDLGSKYTSKESPARLYKRDSVFRDAKGRFAKRK